MDTNTVVKENKSVLPSALCVIVNVAVTYAVMLVCLFVFALIVTYTDFPEEFVSAVVLVMTVISIMLSGILTARKSGRKGWLCGAVSGVVYMLTLFGLSALAFRNARRGYKPCYHACPGAFCRDVRRYTWDKYERSKEK